jgi:Domain of unknown function (DUF4124)
MKNFLAFIAPFLAVAVLTLSPFALADIYQWKDAEGKTQYSDQPPMDRPARLVKSGAVVATVAAEKTDEAKSEKKGPKSLDEKDQDFRKRKIAAEKAEKEAAAKAAEKKAECLAAKNDLKDMTESNRVYERNEKGEKQYLDDKQRDKYAAEVNAKIKQNCS